MMRMMKRTSEEEERDGEICLCYLIGLVNYGDF
jgi:hypothetical protein